MHPLYSAVSDADGDIVQCRWAESTQNECACVCKGFQANLNKVGLIFLLLSIVNLKMYMTLQFF